jgi:hypothetical protein
VESVNTLQGRVRRTKGRANTRNRRAAEARATSFEAVSTSRVRWRQIMPRMPRPRMRALARWQVIPLAGASLAVVACLLSAGEPGFPEDDGWIHQDFARTLALTGHFALQPGGSGAGSTSPLWVLLLAPLHLLTQGRAPMWLVVGWSALLGGLALASLGILSGVAAAEVARRNGASARVAGAVAGLAGLATVGEWHLIWAAVSGMETDLFALLTLLLIVATSRRVRPVWLGLLAGATVAARPEGALVALLVAAGAAWGALRPGMIAKERVHARGFRLRSLETRAQFGAWLRRWGLPFSIGMLICAVPYVALNVAVGGHILPSTFYAKQGGVLQIDGTLARLHDYVVQMGIVMVGINPVLLVVAALAGGDWIRRLILAGRSMLRRHPARATHLEVVRQQAAAPPALLEYQQKTTSADGTFSQAMDFPLATLLWLWPLVLAASYATRLPGAWQYGRYLMPALPPLLALGAAGVAPSLHDARKRFLPFASILVGAAALLSLGGASQVYAGNVHDVNDYHLAAALWLRAHATPGSLIATHDIGAIGYFSDHPVIDFAGLANPELIPLLGNQAAIEAYLRRHHAAYVVMRPDWFPPPAQMAHDLAEHAVYQACGLGECFVIYHTGW